MPVTVSDFWRMIWDEGVRTLVMLTKTQEKGKVGVVMIIIGGCG